MGSLESARLYAICDCDTLARMPLDAIDVLQLRDKHAPAKRLRECALRAREACTGTLLILNDDPQLAIETGADGVHLGQDDADPASVPNGLLVGLSTHTPQQIDAVPARVDYIGVGPVFATPTKPGVAPVGTELVAYAAAHARVPFFAIGGIDSGNVAAVRAAGATGIAVVRAIAAAPDPQAAARALRQEAQVGAA